MSPWASIFRSTPAVHVGISVLYGRIIYTVCIRYKVSQVNVDADKLALRCLPLFSCTDT